MLVQKPNTISASSLYFKDGCKSFRKYNLVKHNTILTKFNKFLQSTEKGNFKAEFK